MEARASSHFVKGMKKPGNAGSSIAEKKKREGCFGSEKVLGVGHGRGNIDHHDKTTKGAGENSNS